MVAGGQRAGSARPAGRLSSCSSGLSGSVLSDTECELLSASYHRDATDWTAADGALLDELVHLLGPAPRARGAGAARLFLDLDSRR